MKNSWDIREEGGRGYWAMRRATEYIFPHSLILVFLAVRKDKESTHTREFRSWANKYSRIVIPWPKDKDKPEAKLCKHILEALNEHSR